MCEKKILLEKFDTNNNDIIIKDLQYGIIFFLVEESLTVIIYIKTC